MMKSTEKQYSLNEKIVGDFHKLKMYNRSNFKTISYNPKSKNELTIVKL